MRRWIPMAMTAALTLAPASGDAQTVMARVLDQETGGPVTGALVHLLDGAGGPVRDQLTDRLGRAMFAGLSDGAYRVRVEMIGRETTSSQRFEVAAGSPVQLDVLLPSSAIALDGIEVSAGERCRVRPEEGLATARVWDEARKALEAASFTDRSNLYRYRTETYVRDLDRDGRVVLREEGSSRVAYLRVPFTSLPAEDLVRDGFLQAGEGRTSVYYAPDAQVLLSDPFLDTHCLRLREGEDEAEGLIGVGFEPVPSRDRDVVDIEGVLWLDPATSELRWLEYRYVNVPPEANTGLVGGFVEFRRMDEGTWIVPEWWIRMPLLVMDRDFSGNMRTRVDGYRQTGGRVTEVQSAGGEALMRGETAAIEGFVQDSLGIMPKQGVRVGVVGSSQMVFTDEEGRFTIGGLTDGVYRIRFVDDELESYGLEPDPIEQSATRGEVRSVYFRMPSVSELAFEACREEAAARRAALVERAGAPLDVTPPASSALPEGTAMLAGRVIDGSNGRALPGVTVRITWEDFRVRAVPGGGAIESDMMGFSPVTDERGYYRACGVPQDTRLRTTLVRNGEEVRGDSLWVPAFTRALAADLTWRP
jgi:hypothetical protein